MTSKRGKKACVTTSGEVSGACLQGRDIVLPSVEKSLEHDYKEEILSGGLWSMTTRKRYSVEMSIIKEEIASVEKSLEHDYKEEILFCHQWRSLWSMTTRKRYCSAISGDVYGA
ncbi:Hypothetical predicted protein [Mytilus galloprovincialis]|uniref:Uncharacterized protein n=1 Tax=Mytilus galloprovincialis TaxID=29158 RepID=A0A8B6FJ79_MYTGA|nr:Hypothetical predicted protein [Mytilus galloprovincialis]